MLGLRIKKDSISFYTAGARAARAGPGKHRFCANSLPVTYGGESYLRLDNSITGHQAELDTLGKPDNVGICGLGDIALYTGTL